MNSICLSLMQLQFKLITLLLIPNFAVANPIQFVSSDSQTTVIELYTSEGCSSCPPADEFLSQFKNSDELWLKYIPLAFHVDYWNYLGWQDTFASAAYSNRQRQHKKQGNIVSVYTPGFVVNGNEWTGFFKPWRALPEVDQQPGQLSLTIDRHLATIAFPEGEQEYQYNLAILGLGLETQVLSGENAGNQLPHDFVVLDHQFQLDLNSTTMTLPLIVGKKPKQFAVVAWLSLPNSLKPIQAVGGLLPIGLIKTI